MEGTVNKFQDDIKCIICEKVFISKKKLKQHVSYVHGNNKKEHICEICSKSFQTKRKLMFHNKTVVDCGGLKHHKCTNCKKSFSQAGNLKKHIHIIHGGHKDYECESCGKSFSAAGNLKLHIQAPGNRGGRGGPCPP